MNELRGAIQGLLKNICQNSFYRIASSNNNPYCVFTLSKVLKEDGRSIFDLEINCFSSNAVNVENLADSIEKQFDQLNYTNEKLSFHSYIDTRNIIEEEDKEIERRRLTFTIYHYTKED